MTERLPFNPDLIQAPADKPVGSSSGLLSVSRVTALVKTAIETSLPTTLHVVGEISNFKRHGSGHLYLTLKDRSSELSCVMWRSASSSLKFEPADGLEVIATGRIEVFERAGRYQLYIRKLEPRGVGALELAFRQLREKLQQEGLFDDRHKRPLPAHPRRIAIVTSPTGAAIADMLRTIARRYPCVGVCVYPVRVQGPGAAKEIAHAVRRINARKAELGGVDLLIVGRGGGSLEDLWAFNEEAVARAIHACRTPVVAAVGHETDTTIADLVADVRAATPSQAGELVVPVRDELVAALRQERDRLVHRMRVRLERAWQRVESLGDRPALRDVSGLLGTRRRHLGQLAERLVANTPAAQLERRRLDLARLAARLAPPMGRRLRRARDDMQEHHDRLGRAARLRYERADRALTGLDARLRALSPLAVLGRGYAIAQRVDGAGAAGAVVRTPDDVAPGDLLRTRVGGGIIDSRVEAVETVRPEGADPVASPAEDL